MTNPLKNVYENANTLIFGGVGTFVKEKRERFFGVLRTIGWLLI